MTTLPELQCFNKLLLKMLERTLKEKEVLMKEVVAASSLGNQYLSLGGKYNSLVDLLSNLGGLDDVFECRQCGEWKPDDEASGNESACDCGWICKDCEEEWQPNWVCNECECTFCKCCEEEDDGIHKYKDRFYCSECFEDVVKEEGEEGEEPLTIEQTNSKRAVMEELIKKFAHSGI